MGMGGVVWFVLFCPIGVTASPGLTLPMDLLETRDSLFKMQTLLSVKELLLIYTLAWIYSSKLPFCLELTALAISFQNKGLEGCLDAPASLIHQASIFRDQTNLCQLSEGILFERWKVQSLLYTEAPLRFPLVVKWCLWLGPQFCAVANVAHLLWRICGQLAVSVGESYVSSVVWPPC